MNFEAQYRLTNLTILAAAEKRVAWLLRGVEDDVDREVERGKDDGRYLAVEVGTNLECDGESGETVGEVECMLWMCDLGGWRSSGEVGKTSWGGACLG